VRRKRVRLAASALGLLLAQVAIGLAVEGPTPATAAPCEGVTRDGAFTKYASPGGTPAAYAVDPLNPKRIYLTDSAAIYRSTNGGCTWKSVYSALDPLPSNPEPSLLTVSDRVGTLVVTPARTAIDPGPVYAVLSPCLAHKVVSYLPGCAVLSSVDDGNHWLSVSTDGLPVDAASIDAFAVSPTDPRRLYALVSVTNAKRLYTSADGGQQWTQLADQVLPPLALDPADPEEMWAGGAVAVMHSTDGGATWAPVPYARGNPVAIDVVHPAGKSPTVTVAYNGAVTQTRDRGRTWTAISGAPYPVTSIAHGSAPGTLAVTTDPTGPSAGAPFVYTPAKGWMRVPGTYRERDATGDGTAAASYFFNDPDLPGLLRYAVPGTTPPRAPDDVQGGGALGTTSGAPQSCYEGRAGRNNPPETSSGPATPAPPNDGVILVTNFDTGCLVSFDRFGHSKILLQAPTTSEGVALTFDKQLMISTRFSNELTRTMLPRQDFEVLDNNIDRVESPAFDRWGNLYVVDNLHNAVYEYPYPQTVGQRRSLVWSFDGFEFLEDVRIAPPGSPFAGDLFVQYAADDAGNGNPNAIAILRRTKNGWRRLADFCHFPGNFTSVALSFLPDGSVLVPHLGGTGTILKYAPDGRSVATFATVGSTPSNQYSFNKMDVTAGGSVYVTAAIQLGGGASVDPDRGSPGGGAAPFAGTRNAIVRFDAAGRRLLPDFTENLSYPVGIAVPNVITGLPRLPLPPPPKVPPVTPPRAVAAPPVPPLPPPPPPPVPGPVAAPGGAPAPAAGPAGQGQAQANPVSQAQQAVQPIPQLGVVAQVESRVQVAVAHANGAGPQSQQNEMAALVLAAATVALGCATRLRSRPQPAYGRTSFVPARRRRRPRGPR
jgi:photosystem II stability/assembly factor-like uncharacterized protein